MIPFHALTIDEHNMFRKTIADIKKQYNNINDEDIFIICSSRDKIKDSPIFINKNPYYENYKPVSYFKKIKNYIGSKL